MKILIIHDADLRIEVLDVANSLIKDDVELFLSQHGYSLNETTWFTGELVDVPVAFHNYKTDDETGEETHTCRNARLRDFSIHEQVQELKKREQDELKAAISKYGEYVDGGYEVHFEGEQPIVGGYLFDEPCDIVITAVRVNEKGYLRILGEDKECRDVQHSIEPDDIFGGHLDYVTSNIKSLNK